MQSLSRIQRTLSMSEIKQPAEQTGLLSIQMVVVGAADILCESLKCRSLWKCNKAAPLAISASASSLGGALLPVPHVPYK